MSYKPIYDTSANLQIALILLKAYVKEDQLILLEFIQVCPRKEKENKLQRPSTRSYVDMQCPFTTPFSCLHGHEGGQGLVSILH